MESQLADMQREMQSLRDALTEAKTGRPLSAEQSAALDWVVKMLSRVEALGWWIGKSKWAIAGAIVLLTQWDRIVETLRLWGGRP